MADELSDDERAIIEKHRAEVKAKQDKADGDLRVVLWHSDGRGAEVPYSKGKKWLADTFGIDVDKEPVQDEPGDDGDEDEGKGKPVTRFGRRVS